MRASDFHSILEGKSVDGLDQLAALKTLTEKYPFFNSAQVLLAKEMWDADHINKQEQVQQAAIRVADRSQLFNLIHGQVEEIGFVAEEQHVVEDSVDGHSEQTGLPDELIPDMAVYDVLMAESVVDQAVEPLTAPDGIAEEESEYSFVGWLSHLDGEPGEKRKKKKKQSKTDLIDQFLANEPQIEQTSHPKFFSPQEMGRKSIQDDFEFVSETLANIYEDQGDFEKAIKAYESLMNRYPEKSSTFAARLKNLREQSKD